MVCVQVMESQVRQEYEAKFEEWFPWVLLLFWQTVLTMADCVCPPEPRLRGPI